MCAERTGEWEGETLLYRKENFRAIQGMLHTMGLYGPSIALKQMICAVELAHEDMKLLQNVTKGLYTRVADYFGNTNTAAVERNLRALRDKMWEKCDRAHFERIACYPIVMKPSTGELIDMIRYYMEINGMFPDE